MCIRLSLPSGEHEAPVGEGVGASFQGLSSAEYPLLAEHLSRFTEDSGWSPSVIVAALQDSHREVWGILDGRQPLAFCVMHIGPFELEIEMIAVAPEHRRRGLATTLLRHAQSRVEVLGKESLLLEVRRSNHAAQHLYRVEGMQQDGIRKGYYPVHGDFSPIAGSSTPPDDTACKPASHSPSKREDALLFSWAPSR